MAPSDPLLLVFPWVASSRSVPGLSYIRNGIQQKCGDKLLDRLGCKRLWFPSWWFSDLSVRTLFLSFGLLILGEASCQLLTIRHPVQRLKWLEIRGFCFTASEEWRPASSFVHELRNGLSILFWALRWLQLWLTAWFYPHERAWARIS